MMKYVFLMLFTACSFGQNLIDTAVIVSGRSDSVKYWDLGGKYSAVYLTGEDTGSTYTDSIKCFAVIKMYGHKDSLVVQLGLINQQTATIDGVTNNPNATTEYLLNDVYIDKLMVVLSNQQFINGRRYRYSIKAVKL